MKLYIQLCELSLQGNEIKSAHNYSILYSHLFYVIVITLKVHPSSITLFLFYKTVR